MSSRSSRIVVVIPARLGSLRLPRKLLLSDTGMSILEHTYRAARQAVTASEVVVATADAEIAGEVESFGGVVAWTSPEAPSGTDRIAEVARSRTEIDIFINLQGDEPEMPPEYIDRVLETLRLDDAAAVSTLAAPMTDHAALVDPSCVKVVVNRLGRAMYFSRSPIPFVRDAMEGSPRACPEIHWQHLGIYAYRGDFLRRLSDLPPSRCEEAERLEQLRFLDAGFTIAVGRVGQATRGIDTPGDYEAFVRRQRESPQVIAWEASSA
ncbi:MAG TPA: 3-deoxy-manno-octulosonate cytidylyltransferase [Pirellulaceae bacterium]